MLVMLNLFDKGNRRGTSPVTLSYTQHLSGVVHWIDPDYFASESRSCKFRLCLNNSIRQFRMT